MEQYYFQTFPFPRHIGRICNKEYRGGMITVLLALLINRVSSRYLLDPEDSVVPMGCFTQTKNKRLLPYVYHTVAGRIYKKYPDILAVYEECKQKAVEYSKPIEIFGIWNFKHCVMTETGKVDEYFKNARNSGKCKTCQNKGIGTSRAVFVYKK